MNGHTSFKSAAPSVLVILTVAAAAVAAGSPGADPTPTPAATKSPIVITNENLSEYAAQGRVTSTETATSGNAKERRPVHKSAAGDDSKTVQDAVADAPQIATDERRKYWRDKYQQQVNLVASIEDQIRMLDYEIPGLWRDFYSRDDPAYRDGVIKPKLDEALARSSRLEKQLATEQETLDRIKVDARKDGAAPGWFRGIAKPTPRPIGDDSKHDVIRD
jgi:hypothetical protein